MTMGLSTVLIGLLPGYETIGVFAPLLLAICRFGQGLGLGGEWGGAVLLATENAPPHRRGWYAMFPQLGAPLGFVLSATSFLLLTETLTDAQFLAWGWRLPFVASLLLVLLGLYVRLKITETPEFQKVVDTEARVAVPLVVLIRNYKRALLLGTLVALATFVLFYLMTVFSLSWATGKLGYSRERYLEIQLIGVAFFAATIPLAAWLSDRYGRRSVLVIATACTGVFGLFFEPLLAGGLAGALAFNVIGLALMGFNYGPIGAALASPFPVSVRYTGASMTFNLAGIFGASLAPYIATWLALNFSLAWVGYYLLGACVLTLAAMLASRDVELSS
jgi:MFS family permease